MGACDVLGFRCSERRQRWQGRFGLTEPGFGTVGGGISGVDLDRRNELNPVGVNRRRIRCKTA